MQVTTIGIDLAKHVFQVHGITKDGEVVFNRAIRRAQLIQFFTKLEPCLIGMEACGTSHYWARESSAFHLGDAHKETGIPAARVLTAPTAYEMQDVEVMMRN